MFYKNIKAEILKRIDVILRVETSANTIQFYVFNLTVLNYSFLWTAKLANKTKKPALAVAKCSTLMTVR